VATAPPPGRPPGGGAPGGQSRKTRQSQQSPHKQGGALRSSVTEGAAVEVDAFALCDALRMRADGGFGVRVEARNREEATVHFERRLRAWPAIVFGWFG